MKLRQILLFTLSCLLSNMALSQVIGLPFTPKKSSFEIMRINVSYRTFMDEALIYGAEGATNGFDKQFDAYKLFGDANAPQIYFIPGAGISPVSVNGVPLLTKGVKASLFIRIPEDGVYNVSFGLTDLTQFSASMLDVKTGNKYYGTSFSFNGVAAEEREFEIEFTDGVYWNGSVDSDWNKVNNWFNGTMPSGTRYAILPKLFVGNNPVVDRYIKLDTDLEIEDGAILTITPTGKLDLQ